MFEAIARFDVRFRWPILILWLAATPTIITGLPTLSSVTKQSNSQFLSPSEPSVRAEKLAASFEGKNPSSTAIIVAARPSGTLSGADNAAFRRVLMAARRVKNVSLVRDEGISRDRRAREALVVSSAAAIGNTGKQIVDDVRATFRRAGAPPGLAFHLGGQLAQTVDSSSKTGSSNIARFTVLFVIVLLLVVYRSVLAPLVTLVPAGLALAVSGPVIAEISKAGLSASEITQELLIVLLVGAGSDYGLFLVFRVREELAGGREMTDAIERALGRVGEAISYSALTVAASLLALLLASFGIYQDLGPALAIGLAILLLASLTLTPALLAIFGHRVFWPSHPTTEEQRPGLWGRLAERVVHRPVAMLAAGVVLFGALAAGIIGYSTAGFTNGPPSGSDSAAAATTIAAHFPSASAGADEILMRFPQPVAPASHQLAIAQHKLEAARVFREVRGPLKSAHVSRLISPDRRTVQFYASLAAGRPGSTAATDAIPQARAAVTNAARAARASESGIAGQDASAYDIQHAANTSLVRVVPVVLVILLALLGVVLRSLIAPWYLVLTVGLSYLASLGFAMLVFVHLGGQSGLNFVLPFLMFVFSMALGEDYNILVMSRIREETHHRPSTREAITHAIGITGGTVTSAGIILAGTFTVLGLAGGNTQAHQIGFSIAFGVLLDTFFVRTLLVPSIATLLGRRNWWPSQLARRAHARPTTTVAAADEQ